MNIDFLKSKKSFKKNEYDFNPRFYWNIILIFFLLALIAIFTFGALYFMETNKDSYTENVGTTNMTEKNRKIRIEKVLEYFSEKEKKSESILSLPSPLVDPSI